MALLPFCVSAEDPLVRTVPEINLQGNGQNIVNKDTTPSSEDGTDLGSTGTEARGKISQTFTIQNMGTGELSLTGSPIVKITGTHASDFGVTQNPETKISSGGSTTFEVTFSPSSGGKRTATVSIANNDADENPYTFAIQGTGNVPDINVKGKNGQVILSGDLTPSVTDGTDFGSVSAQARAQVKQDFYIENLGSATLSISGVKIEGTQAGDFRITHEPITTLSPAESTRLEITFAPQARGIRNATIMIPNNDKDESIYKFAVKGNGLSPEIDVLGNGISIPKGDTSPGSSDGTDFGSIDAELTRTEDPAARGTVTKMFTIKNQGNLELNLTGSPIVEISGEHAGDFTVVQFPSSSIIAAKSSTFKIEFRPRGDGVRHGIITIVNDDLNESPYTFWIKGTGLTPDIALQWNGEDIEDGDTTPTVADGTDFGGTDVLKGSIVRSFTLKNFGKGKLNVENVTISGENKDDFSVTAKPASVLSANGSTTFKINFVPKDGGTRKATVSIQNNDAQENPFNFDIQGEGYPAEINLKGNGNNIVNEDDTPSMENGTDLGPAAINSTGIVQTFKIQNVGTGKLFLTGSPLVSLTADVDKSDFAVTVNPVTPISPGVSVDFKITFKPKGGGTRTATLRIPNSDTDESPYTFKIQGTGVDSPEIDLLGNGKSIPDGDITPVADDDTDFGGVMLPGATEERTYTIQNHGNANLKLTANPPITITGTNASDFQVTAMPNTTITPGTSTTFTVRFSPKLNGKRKAILNIGNNDPNENPYNFYIQGTGTSVNHEIQVMGNGAEIADGDTTPSASDHTEFGNVTVAGVTLERVFTINNIGGANLYLTGTPKVQITGTHASEFTVVAEPVSPVVGNASTTFAIRFDPGASGLRSATVSVSNNDSNENPYDFAIQGTGVFLDNAFDKDGKVTTPIGPGNDAGYCVALQPDGKIVVAGLTDNDGRDFAVARYSETGGLDTTFNGTGRVSTPVGSGNDDGYAVALQSDGRIVVAGSSSNGTDDDFAVVRYNADGSLDTRINATGKGTTPIGSGND